MNRGQEFCKIVADDEKHQVLQWIMEGLKLPISEVNELCTMGFLLDKRLIGGVLYEGDFDSTNIWLSIYTIDKRWCSKRTLRAVFDFAFNVLKALRVSILVNTDNYVSERFVTKLGFRKEGELRQFREGKDVYVFGMLKNECKFIKGDFR